MPEKLSFEESLRRLEQIAQTLESGQAGLDESMELYAQAAKLIAFCQKKLDNAQLKMEKLTEHNLANRQKPMRLMPGQRPKLTRIK